MLFETLSQVQKQQINASVADIVKEFPIVKVICFGIRTSESTRWSPFVSPAQRAAFVSFDLLFIIRDGEYNHRNGILKVLAQHICASQNINTLIHSSEAVQKELNRGNRFFSTVWQQGAVLYESSPVQLRLGSCAIITSTQKQAYWKFRKQTAEAFLDSAAAALEKNKLVHCMFLLHQVVEHCCIGLIKISTGYAANTHKLSSILDLVDNFWVVYVDVFERRRDRDIRLLQLLEKAYVAARYDEAYVVEAVQVHKCIEAVATLLEQSVSFADNYFKKEGVKATRIEVPFFKSIHINTFARIVLVQCETQFIQIESEYNCLGNLNFFVENERLNICSVNLDPQKVYDATVTINFPDLDGIILLYAESLRSEGKLVFKSLGVINNGPSSIDLSVQASSLDITIYKHGKVSVQGTSDVVSIYSNRTGEFNGGNLATEVANILIKGQGNVLLQVAEEISADLKGSGNLTIIGNPHIRKLINSGTGNLIIQNI